MIQLRRARLLLALLSLSVAVAMLAGCKPGATGDAGRNATASTAARSTGPLDPLLAEPQVGDLWAAELSHFSGGEFSQNGKERETVYGLMKVIDASPDDLVLVTETGAWPKKQGAINDLRGDLADIEWDENEKITVRRSEIAGLVGEGRIVEARRLAGD
ncbi:hypothetical protein B1992_03925 [Pseudoxanthomonas broegbernensis]|uniref:Uncharacterized protein n=1 Tax=Pseudoxanthomonas broegbernensis TaxID=83619 RepID=A0A7V8K802_9GAMM|nr:hypothetical protein [Pseudoxanthomonas broegbernensis]KAF1687146.1 hypothetical protein B1992_03925 [Pseudoxanthomonas broegbernensis]MBB6065876.1 hypothetical protein [Pseudoxanthomonas broegbernensis]